MQISSKIFRKNPSEIRIPRRVLAARLGFKGVGDIPDSFKGHFERAYKIAIEVADPVAVYGDFPVEDLDDGVEIDGKVLKGRSIEDFVKGSRSATLIVATLGSEYDETMNRFHEKGDDLTSFFLDGIGSEMVEYFIRDLDSLLRKEKGEGGPRISPGYGDLPLSLNAWIIEKLDAGKIGVSYDPETFIMVPRKTISALIGWR